MPTMGREYRYTRHPKNIRFDEETLEMVDLFIQTKGHQGMTFSDVVRMGVNSWVRDKMETLPDRSVVEW